MLLYCVYMAYGVLILLFVIVVMVIFFLVISDGFADMWETIKDVFQYKQTSALLWAGVLLTILIVVGGGVVREGLTIMDILIWL